MKLFKLIAVLSLVGCGGPEFVAADQKVSINKPEAGAAGQNDAGEGGEVNSAGLNSGGSYSFAGNETGGKDIGGSAGKDTGGSASGGSVIGGTASAAGTGGTSAGNTFGGAGAQNTCTYFVPAIGEKMPCSGVIYKYEGQEYKAEFQFKCTEKTSDPSTAEGTARQCVLPDNYELPSDIWCCTNR